MKSFETKTPKPSNVKKVFYMMIMVTAMGCYLSFLMYLPDAIFSKSGLSKSDVALFLPMILGSIYIINEFFSMKKKSEQTNETITEVNQKLEQIASAQSILAKGKDTYEETLRKEFLAVKKPYIYYTDTERLSNFYNEEIAGRQSLEKLITKTGQELKGEAKAGVKDIVHGGIDGRRTENREEEFRVREPSILEMLLGVQTRFLKNDYFTLGIEKDLSEGIFHTSEPNASDEIESIVFAESQRLKDLEGMILVKIGFALKLSEPDQSHYTLSFTRRIVESIEQSPVVTFNTSFPRNSIAENDKFMFEKNLESTIKLVLFGHVTSSINSNEGNMSINIVPYAIYSP